MRRAAMLAAVAVLAAAACADNANGEPDPANETSPAAPNAERPEPADGAPPGLTEEPVWAAPPPGEIGAPVDFEPFVFEGEDVAVTVAALTAYGDGVELHLTVRYHPDGDLPGDEPLSPMSPGPGWLPGDQLPRDLLRASVTYPDGRHSRLHRRAHGPL